MGCSSSRNPNSTISISPLQNQNQNPLFNSTSTHPIVYHPSLHPGDSSHTVSLISTTYNYNSPMDSTNRFHLPRSFTYHHKHNHKPLWAHLAAADDSSSSSSFSSSSSSSLLCIKSSSLLRQRPSPTIVLYITSLRGIRRTYEDCCSIRNILCGFRVAVDERDVSMDSSYRTELQSLLRLQQQGRGFSLPQLFVGGKLVGGAEEVRQMHEDGELRKVLEGVERVDPCFVCGACGGARFVPCGECSGSRKVFEEEEGRVRRCGNCNENGLLRCPSCSLHPSSLSKPYFN